MPKLTLLVGTVMALAAMALAGSALAGKPPKGPDPCQSGTLTPGAYKGLIVTGNCTIMSGPVTINGDVTVADGGYLNAGWLGTRLTINGDVKVGKGATLGLGCAYFYERLRLCAWAAAAPVGRGRERDSEREHRRREGVDGLPRLHDRPRQRGRQRRRRDDGRLPAAGGRTRLADQGQHHRRKPDSP